MSVDRNKAPDLDGFTFKFVQAFWSELKGEVLSLFQQFYETTEFEHRFFSSFIALIPKIGCSFSLNGFRPILLLG